jgi:hypothetical protein
MPTTVLAPPGALRDTRRCGQFFVISGGKISPSCRKKGVSLFAIATASPRRDKENTKRWDPFNRIHALQKIRGIPKDPGGQLKPTSAGMSDISCMTRIFQKKKEKQNKGGRAARQASKVLSRVAYHSRTIRDYSRERTRYIYMCAIPLCGSTIQKIVGALPYKVLTASSPERGGSKNNTPLGNNVRTYS